MAGTVATDGRLSLGSPIDWDASSFGDQLERHHRGMVCVVNDGAATAVGECLHRGSQAAPLLAVSVGTGLGGGLIADGGSYRGANAMSLEVGHLIVEPSGRSCRCSGQGCLQACASGWAIGKTFRDRRALPGIVDGKAVVAAAAAGDSVDVEVLAEAGAWLGLGLASLVAIVDPRVIVLIGASSMRANCCWRAPSACSTSVCSAARSGFWPGTRPGVAARPLWSARRPRPPDSPPPGHIR